MAAIKSDNPLDLALEKNKRELSALQLKIQVVMATLLQLPPKERAARLQEITNSLGSIQRFIDQSKSQTITNAGTRFGIENLKNSFQILYVRWKKFERTLGDAVD